MKLKILILLFFLIGGKGLFAQDPCSININKSKGLPSNAVYAMLQDAKGYVWLTHDEGLTRYDATYFKTYSSALQTSASGSDVHQDKDGNIWYQNFDGYIYYIENDSLHALVNQQKSIGYYHLGMVGKSIFLMQPKGVDVFDWKTKKHIKHITFSTNALGYTAHTATHYYVLSDRLYEINQKGEMMTIKLPIAMVVNRVKMFSVRGKLFLLSEEGSRKVFYVLQNGILKKTFEVNLENEIQNVSVAGNEIWACTTHGTYQISSTGQIKNKGHAYFSSKSITCVMQDREKNFWFGTANEGILLVPDLNTRLLKLDNYKPNRAVANNNSLIIATQNDQLLHLNLQTLEIKMLSSNAANQQINQLYYDEQKEKILYTSQEFYMAGADGKKRFAKPIAVKQICKLNQKYYAFAASGIIGLFTLDTKMSANEWDTMFNNHLLTKGAVTFSQLKAGIRGKSVVYNAGNNTVYFATNNGLFSANPKGLQELNTGKEKLFISKLAIYQNMLFALSTKGLLYVLQSDNTLKHITLINEAIKDIKILQSKLFIFISNELGYVDLNAKTQTYKKVEMGLYSDEINDVVMWQGKLILLSNNGLITGSLEGNAANKSPVLFDIISFKISDKNFDISATPSVSYKENEVEIDYALLGFGLANHYPLYYIINNEKPRLCASETRSLKLPALASGNYTISFRFAGSNRDLKTLHFTIGKPFWQQWWFIGLCLLLLLSTVYIYFKIQIRGINKRNTLLAEKVELEQNLNTSMLTSIKAQMNPHFFYNALNTIQSFIFSNEKEKASAYLNKFSKLTRVILEMSEKESVTLAEEINAIMLYLEIEKARFNEDFRYSINVAENIDTEMMRIPSMIVQPYIENAIKHGLLHKKGEKKLDIKFEMDLKNLTISIEDNGVGRKVADELNKKKHNTHKPFATKANQKRIDLLNKGFNVIGVNYIDNENPSGTVVKIVLPLHPLKKE